MVVGNAVQDLWRAFNGGSGAQGDGAGSPDVPGETAPEVGNDHGLGLAPRATREQDPEFKEILGTLRRAVRWLRYAATLTFAVAAAATALAIVVLPEFTEAASRRISASGESVVVMIFELLRGAAFTAAVTSVLFGIYNLGKACLDQATRFQKRLIAAHFLHYVLHPVGTERPDGTIQDAVAFLEAWGANVESAFSSVKFRSENHATKIASGVSGVSASTEDSSRPIDQSLGKG